VGSELERPLDAAAAGRREVEGDEQEFHRAMMLRTRCA
jgi:hypothetical protein